MTRILLFSCLAIMAAAQPQHKMVRAQMDLPSNQQAGQPPAAQVVGQQPPQAEAVKGGSGGPGLKQQLGGQMKNLAKLEDSAKDEGYVPWAMGWIHTATNFVL